MGSQVKDVKLPPDSPTQLLLNKHADFIAAYGKKKDDYVCKISVTVFQGRKMTDGLTESLPD